MARPCYALTVPGQFDTTTKSLVEKYPKDWFEFLGLPTSGPVTVIDADLFTVTAEVDKALRLEEPEPLVVHLEFQSSYDPTMGCRIYRYFYIPAHNRFLMASGG